MSFSYVEATQEACIIKSHIGWQGYLRVSGQWSDSPQDRVYGYRYRRTTRHLSFKIILTLVDLSR
jgi:hypothetical protein